MTKIWAKSLIKMADFLLDFALGEFFGIQIHNLTKCQACRWSDSPKSCAVVLSLQCTRMPLAPGRLHWKAFQACQEETPGKIQDTLEWIYHGWPGNTSGSPVGKGKSGCHCSGCCPYDPLQISDRRRMDGWMFKNRGEILQIQHCTSPRF